MTAIRTGPGLGPVEAARDSRAPDPHTPDPRTVPTATPNPAGSTR